MIRDLTDDGRHRLSEANCYADLGVVSGLIGVYHSVGKFSNIRNESSSKILIYLIYNELSMLLPQIELANTSAPLLATTIIQVLNNMDHEANSTIIPFIFKPLIENLIKSAQTNVKLAVEAVKFMAKWCAYLDIGHAGLGEDEGVSRGYEQLVEGLLLLKKVQTDNFDEKMHQKSIKRLRKVSYFLIYLVL